MAERNEAGGDSSAALLVLKGGPKTHQTEPGALYPQHRRPTASAWSPILLWAHGCRRQLHRADWAAAEIPRARASAPFINIKHHTRSLIITCSWLNRGWWTIHGPGAKPCLFWYGPWTESGFYIVNGWKKKRTIFHDPCKLWETQSLESVNIYWDITTFIHLHIAYGYLWIKKQRHHFDDRVLYSQSCDFSSSHVWMWKLDHKEGWAPKNWCFWTELSQEKTLESPLDVKKIRQVLNEINPSNQYSFIRKTDADAEAPLLWPPVAKSRLTGEDPDAGEDWRQEKKGTTEDEMVGWHHQLNGLEFKQTPGYSVGQRSLACCSLWGCEESTWLRDWTTTNGFLNAQWWSWVIIMEHTTLTTWPFAEKLADPYHRGWQDVTWLQRRQLNKQAGWLAAPPSGLEADKEA